MAAGQGPLTLRNTMNRIAALAVTAAATAATLAAIAGGASAATTPAPATTTTAAAVTPGIGAMLWAGSNQITVTPGSTKTIYVAFYSTGPRETAAVSTAVTTTGAHAAAVRTAAADISIPAADATITRGSGATFSWTGGAAGTYVVIGGSSTGTSSGGFGSFICIAPVAAGQFTVPSYVLSALPAGTGSTSVANVSSYGTFSAPGLNAGAAFGEVSQSIGTTFK